MSHVSLQISLLILCVFHYTFRHFFSLTSAFSTYETSVWISCYQPVSTCLVQEYYVQVSIAFLLEDWPHSRITANNFVLLFMLINNVHMTPCTGLGLGLWAIQRGTNSMRCKAFSLVLGSCLYPAAALPNGLLEDLPFWYFMFYLGFSSLFLRSSLQRVFLR